MHGTTQHQVPTDVSQAPDGVIRQTSDFLSHTQQWGCRDHAQSYSLGALHSRSQKLGIVCFPAS